MNGRKRLYYNVPTWFDQPWKPPKKLPVEIKEASDQIERTVEFGAFQIRYLPRQL
jgi:hypothetical protein